MSPIVIIVLIVILLILLLLVAVCIYFYGIAISRQEKKFLVNNPDLRQIVTSDIPVFEPSWIETQAFETLEIRSYDGLRLKGYYLQAPSPTTKTVILAHGYTGSAKQNMGPFARMYHELFGYNVLMPDARGHGESEGSYIGLGWHDRLDYLQWLQTLIQRVGEDAQIVLHGLSMGGATVLITSGEQLPAQVNCIVADCAYTSANAIFSYQIRRMYRLSPFPFIQLTSLICKLRAGYFFREVDALVQVRKTEKPVLFIHGEEDTFVPTEMVKQLYAACKTYKQLFLVSRAGHGMAYTVDPTGYTQQTKDFTEKFVS